MLGKISNHAYKRRQSIAKCHSLHAMKRESVGKNVSLAENLALLGDTQKMPEGAIYVIKYLRKHRFFVKKNNL